MDYKKYLAMTKSEAYIELHKYYTQETILDVLGVARQENPHSAFLRWLFDIKGSHGLGDLPLRRLLETVCLAKEEIYEEASNWFQVKYSHSDWNLLSKNQKEYYEYIKYGRYEVLDEAIANELVLEKQRRADIFIVAKVRFYDAKDAHSLETDKTRYVVIVIENKIHSLEHDRQTVEYEEAVFNKERAEKYISDCFNQTVLMNSTPLILPIYLNASPKHTIMKALEHSVKKSEVLPASRQFITLNYQYILDGVLETVLPYCTIDVAAKRISEYIRCLGQATLTSDSGTDSDIKKSNQQHLIMAVTSREKELAKSLLADDYKQILQEIFRSFASEETGLVDQQEQSFWTSIANVYNYLLQEQDMEPDEELQEAVNCVLKTTNGMQAYYLKFGDKLIGFGSGIGKKNEQTVGELAYYLIAEYIKNHTGETWDSLVSRLYSQNSKSRITNNWLCGCLMPQTHVDELAKAWALKYTADCKAVCGKYNSTSGFVNGELHSCVLWSSSKNPLHSKYSGNKADRVAIENLYSCPIYSAETNVQLWNAYRSKEASDEFKRTGRNVAGKGCHCIYDFLNYFFVNGLQDSCNVTTLNGSSIPPSTILGETPKVSRSNKLLPPIVMGSEKVYVARFWTTSDIPKLVELLGMGAYISTSVHTEPKTPMSIGYISK